MSKIKVIIVDDSSVIRNIIQESLKAEPNIEVVAEAADPFEARELIKKHNPDVLTLDIEMPKMDGITFLKNLMKLRPMPVVMLSTLTTKGADITLEALEIGAVDFIAKPNVQTLVTSIDSFSQLLIRKINQAASVEQKTFRHNQLVAAKNTAVLKQFTGIKTKNHLVAIGASTGGTEAIKSVLTCLPQNAPPVVIAQHIPENFSARFAQRLDDCCAVQVHEASHGQKIKPGNVYIAPGNLHLKIVLKGGTLFCTLDDSEEVNRHKPSVDVLFNSLLPVANHVHAILLTGMGQDGAQGMLNLKDAGAYTIIQNKASSLIWGMPGKAHALNAHCQQFELSDISKNILDIASLERGAIHDV